MADINNPLVCPRCKTILKYIGERRFHEGTKWGVFGNIGELFVNSEKFEIYVCSKCGRVEFFIDGVGEEYRIQYTDP